jgi:hypothetical protein
MYRINFYGEAGGLRNTYAKPYGHRLLKSHDECINCMYTGSRLAKRINYICDVLYLWTPAEGVLSSP